MLALYYHTWEIIVCISLSLIVCPAGKEREYPYKPGTADLDSILNCLNGIYLSIMESVKMCYMIGCLCQWYFGIKFVSNGFFYTCVSYTE